MEKKITCFIAAISLVLIIVSANAQTSLSLSSPNGRIKVDICLDDKIYYSIYSGGQVLLSDCQAALHLSDCVLGENPRLKAHKESERREVLNPVVPIKYAEVRSFCKVLSLDFKNDYSVEFRVFDNAVAYRFITKIKKPEIEVLNETFALNFVSDYQLHIQPTNSFKTAYEEPYEHLRSSAWQPEDKMSTLPLLIESVPPYKILVSESDLSDYPAMFLTGMGKFGIQAIFPRCPLKFAPESDRSLWFLEEADYLAKTKGQRTFPWRYFVIAKEDKDLLENTITMQLSAPNQLEDPSWICPGQVSWEWWNGASPYGPDVDFVAGYNLDTYKYYIDFASRFGIEYIIMDEGWAMSSEDPFTPNPEVDVHELIRYGKEKNVGIILWLTWLTVEKHMNLFEVFSEWGVKGVKIDFMDRSDQWMVNYYEKVAREAAKHRILVNFHGSFKPAGLEYKYPNVISYEGVRGMEQMEGCTPDNSLYFPFIRNAVGPMDYTPGAMLSMQPEVYCSQRPNSASIGTRAYQMALFVVFESGLQMLADSPTNYYRNQECTEFITQVPTTWDETRVLAAKIGEYVVVAKRKDKKWFIGGITNNNERSISISLDFLEPGKSYNTVYFEDGVNADRQAMDYRRKQVDFSGDDKFTIQMKRNGGFAAILQQD